MQTRVSRYTFVVSGVLLLLALAVYGTTRVLLAGGNEAAATAVGDIGSALVIGTCAVTILIVAFRFHPGDAVRLQWFLIGFSILVYALGEASWAYVEVVQHSDAFPSFADAFYVLTYPLLAAGIVLAALGYRKLVDERMPLLLTTAACAALLAVLYALLLRDTVADPSLAMLAKTLSVGYPVGDVLLELGPALFIALVAWRLGRGSFGWPWWPLALGVAIIALSDSGFALLDAKGLYAAGNPIDAGWMIGNVFIATGALVARDVFGVRRAAKAEKAAA